MRLNENGSVDDTYFIHELPPMKVSCEPEKDDNYFKSKEYLYADYEQEGRFISWALVMDRMDEGSFITEFPEQLKRSKEFRACPECNCPAEQLTWINFSTPRYMWLKLVGSQGYMGICQPCKRQVGYYEIRCR